MNDFPYQLTNRRHVFGLAERRVKGVLVFRKILDQDEFLGLSIVLDYIVERKTVKSIYEITKYLKKSGILYGNADNQTKALLFLLLLNDPQLATLVEEIDEKLGQKTRCVIKPTPAGVKWLKENKELITRAVEVKQNVGSYFF